MIEGLGAWVSMAYIGAATVVLLALFFSLVRVFRGPTPVERLLAAQLMGTAGVSVLLLLDTGLKRADMAIPGLINVSLVFAVLAGVVGVAFVFRGWEWKPLDADSREDADGADA